MAEQNDSARPQGEPESAPEVTWHHGDLGMWDEKAGCFLSVPKAEADATRARGPVLNQMPNLPLQPYNPWEAQRQTRGVSAEQFQVLMQDLAPTRVAKRRQGGKQLSYVEAWDIKAHLIRIFGFGNFDSETVREDFLGTRPYQNEGKEMVEVIWKATHRLVVRDQQGRELARYTEGAVGSASGPVNTLGDLHDNALKTAASDALKRCAINLGTQFGLSLYNDGSTKDVVKRALVRPDGTHESPTEVAKTTTPEQDAALQRSLAAQQTQQQEPDQPEPAYISSLRQRLGNLPVHMQQMTRNRWPANLPPLARLTEAQAKEVNALIDSVEQMSAEELAAGALGATPVTQ